MISPVKSNLAMLRVTELYVAVFPIRLPGENTKAETILAGYIKDSDETDRVRVRATVETHISAVPGMVAMCDRIVAQKEGIESYRLLKFDARGIHTLDPADFRDIRNSPLTHYPEMTWGSC